MMAKFGFSDVSSRVSNFGQDNSLCKFPLPVACQKWLEMARKGPRRILTFFSQIPNKLANSLLNSCQDLYLLPLIIFLLTSKNIASPHILSLPFPPQKNKFRNFSSCQYENSSHRERKLLTDLWGDFEKTNYHFSKFVNISFQSLSKYSS